METSSFGRKEQVPVEKEVKPEVLNRAPGS